MSEQTIGEGQGGVVADHVHDRRPEPKWTAEQEPRIQNSPMANPSMTNETSSPTNILGRNGNAGTVLESLISLYYQKAKAWRVWHLAIEMAIYMAGIAAVFFPKLPLEYPAIGLLLVLTTALLSAKEEKLKSIAETLKRQHEYWQGLGVPPARGLLAELQVRAPGSLTKEIENLLREGLTFSSVKSCGPERALENLSESSWFTKELAAWCGDRLREVFIGSVLVAVIVLLVIASSVGAGTTSTGIAKCVASSLAFLMSVGVLRSWLAYERYSREAGEIEAEAQRLLKAAPVNAFDAQRLLAEYQLVRASAPAIPTLVWSRRRDKLNRAWNELKRPSTPNL